MFVGVCSQARKRTTNCDMWHIYFDLLLFNYMGREGEGGRERERDIYIYLDDLRCIHIIIHIYSLILGVRLGFFFV